MRETLDCAVLMTPGHEAWVREWVGQHRDTPGRLQLYAQELSSLAPGAPDTQLLSRARLALRRFDGCVLPVAPASLPWVRTVLANAGAAGSGPRTPLVALVFGITAPAILDLLALGAADFMRAPACLDELRARLLRLHRLARQGAQAFAGSPADATPPAASALQEPLSAYGARPMARLAVPRGRPEPGWPEAPARGPHPDEPFRQAKARVVDGFEREYLRRALSRHAGNVAQAARASCKHRRAFWALMRKHHIDAAPYRNGANSA